jgi:hypothetical protein
MNANTTATTVQSNLALVNLKEPLSQKFSKDASRRFADYGNAMGVLRHNSWSRTPAVAKKMRRVPLRKQRCSTSRNRFPSLVCIVPLVGKMWGLMFLLRPATADRERATLPNTVTVTE